MKILSSLVLLTLLSINIFGQTKTIHTFVALCDNINQGIVPVPKSLGNGQDTKNNLYWGATYGVKSYFKNKTSDWNLVSTFASNNPIILERILFKHKSIDVYMLADAYDGEKIKTCIEDFLKASNGQKPITITHDKMSLDFGGSADLVSYIGHDGLMDFDINITYKSTETTKKDAIVLACYSKNYFSSELKSAKANPILWTTHLMAPEAYVLKAALDGWIHNETGKQIDERAAQAYHKYQKCGIKGARNLFTTGF
ncbi:hypothetical protein FF125_05865 [Aureibaculum algae]|uniref:Uncharacterized protein n=1 Tax=Aureibaculum algae TaxID=2584122 RepID=A0A5B7TS22_9FLAO|nr:hypothetical protein [Aureibaculum algae]QCX37983.1 hypothetical protein FF125_05865 [Aureibaculum algae]